MVFRFSLSYNRRKNFVKGEVQLTIAGLGLWRLSCGGIISWCEMSLSCDLCKSMLLISFLHFFVRSGGSTSGFHRKKAIVAFKGAQRS